MFKIEEVDDKQFPYLIHGVNGRRNPQKFTKAAFIELHKLMDEKLTATNKAKDEIELTGNADRCDHGILIIEDCDRCSRHYGKFT